MENTCGSNAVFRGANAAVSEAGEERRRLVRGYGDERRRWPRGGEKVPAAAQRVPKTPGLVLKHLIKDGVMILHTRNRGVVLGIVKVLCQIRCQICFAFCLCLFVTYILRL